MGEWMDRWVGELIYSQLRRQGWLSNNCLNPALGGVQREAALISTKPRLLNDFLQRTQKALKHKRWIT